MVSMRKLWTVVDIVARVDVLTPQDATRFWLARRGCNDLFLLYCFDDTGCPSGDLRAAALARSAEIPDLRVRVREYRFAYPAWEPCGFDEAQVVVHHLGEPLWTNVEAALGELLGEGVPADRYAWRLHLFRGIRDAPGGTGPGLVVVLQLSHALADGKRAAAIARELLGGPAEGDVGPSDRAAVPGVAHGMESCAAEAISLFSVPLGLVRTVRRGLAAARADGELSRLATAGEIPGAAGDFAPTLLNRPPAPRRRAVRMIVDANLRAPGYTVTVVASTAISVAMSRYLAARGEPIDALGAQVSMALPSRSSDALRSGKRMSRNNYRDLGIDLAVAEPDLRLRADRIAATLAERRIRATHPLQSVRDRVTDALPAPILRRDIANFPLDLVPGRISGNTVLSSVDRGPADLSIAGGRVRFTAGFPALGAVMHLTHGLHGLGDTVTLSIHSDPQAMPDVDEYAGLLRAAVREVVDALAES
ncbi:WSD1 family O-acyltransferase [Nocardia spumae]|uniref:WSD1 family O-acyltransferase n=1 Tax=Nocardia spumae TaxID=2887190 RepID=UPI001D13776C|nr:WSD1 family O-acyltransferase [Nocardia spumae]